MHKRIFGKQRRKDKDKLNEFLLYPHSSPPPPLQSLLFSQYCFQSCKKFALTKIQFDVIQLVRDDSVVWGTTIAIVCHVIAP